MHTHTHAHTHAYSHTTEPVAGGCCICCHKQTRTAGAHGAARVQIDIVIRPVLHRISRSQMRKGVNTRTSETSEQCTTHAHHLPPPHFPCSTLFPSHSPLTTHTRNGTHPDGHGTHVPSLRCPQPCRTLPGSHVPHATHCDVAVGAYSPATHCTHLAPDSGPGCQLPLLLHATIAASAAVRPKPASHVSVAVAG